MTNTQPKPAVRPVVEYVLGRVATDLHLRVLHGDMDRGQTVNALVAHRKIVEAKGDDEIAAILLHELPATAYFRA